MRGAQIVTCIVVSPFLLVGCSAKINESGEDLAFLQDHDHVGKTQRVVTASQLLPLAKGNYWEMEASSGGQTFRERMIVTGPMQVGKEAGMQVQILRGGQLWRIEVYQNKGKGLYLLGFGRNKADLLVLQPPFPISRAEVKEGESLAWKGTVLLQGKPFRASGYSRITSSDNVTITLGRLQAYRLDSVVTMQQPDGPLHFPNARWLNPGIGFIRRGYADNGIAALSEITSYMVGSKNP